jgi:hypothetical protein
MEGSSHGAAAACRPVSLPLWRAAAASPGSCSCSARRGAARVAGCALVLPARHITLFLAARSHLAFCLHLLHPPRASCTAGTRRCFSAAFGCSFAAPAARRCARPPLRCAAAAAASSAAKARVRTRRQRVVAGRSRRPPSGTTSHAPLPLPRPRRVRRPSARPARGSPPVARRSASVRRACRVCIAPRLAVPARRRASLPSVRRAVRSLAAQLSHRPDRR